MTDSPGQNQPVRLPLFPLQTVLLPGAHLPLHIFEPRYRQLTRDIMQGTVPEHRFGIVALKSPTGREHENLDHLQGVGCAAILRTAEQLPDGRFDIVATGERRFRLLDIDTRAAPYLVGTVEWVPDAPLPSYGADIAERLAKLARGAHRRYCAAAWERDRWEEPADDTELAELSYALAADCLLPLCDRQALLEQIQPLRRLRMICQFLTREAGFLSQLRAVPGPLVEAAAMAAPSLN